jgi:microcystin-dependent protein
MPAQQIQKGTTYADFPGANSQVTAENLNDHVDNAVLLPGAISAQTTGTPEEADYILAERAGALFKYTIESVKTLFSSIFVPLAGGTMTGPLLLNTSNPSTSATAASKGYVDATVGASILPGQIVMWGTSTPPAGWLECNGQSTAGYPNLTALFGTNLPDLRGEFVRGWSNNRTTVDYPRDILSAQAQEIQAHTHSYTAPTIIQDAVRGDASGRDPRTAAATTGSTGGAETRPRNVALMFIIKT